MKTALRKKRSFGIDIGYASVKIIEVMALGDKRYEIRQIHDIPVPSGLKSEDSDFPSFLKPHLDAIVCHMQNTDLWGSISSEQVEMRCIRIPKIPPKQLPKAVRWAFTKEVGHDFDQSIFDFEIIGEVLDEGTNKLEVMVATAPKDVIFQREQTFARTGYPITGISVIPFAIQNLIRCDVIPPGEKDMCHLYIGRNWSRIAIFSKGNLLLSRGIKTGIKSMIEDIKVAQGIEINGLSDLDEGDLLISSDTNAQELFFSCMAPHAKSSLGKKDSNESCGLAMGMINPSLKRLVKQMERTFEHYILNFKSDGIGTIYISGILCRSDVILNYIHDHLEMPVEIMDPFSKELISKMNGALPKEKEKREALIPSLGMALSQKEITPNFILTYKEKAREKKLQRINWMAFSFCIAILCGMSIYFFSQRANISQKKLEIETLNAALQQYSIPTDQNTLLQLIAQFNATQKTTKETSLRLAPIALVKEIINGTPPLIKLIKLSVDFRTPVQKHPLVILEGMISGDASGWESHLTRFGFHLNQSPLFGPPSIKNKKKMMVNNERVQLFSMTFSFLNDQ